MKKYFIMAVAVLASLTACQKDPEQIIVNDGTIKFMSVQTRALSETEVVTEKTLKDKNFTVYGHIKGEDDALWEEGIVPTYQTTGDYTGQWVTTERKYWAEAKVYNFYAFYNQGSNVISDFEETVVTFDGGAEATTDFVAASSCNILGNVFNAPVQLTFKHQLSRVAINFVNMFDDATTIKVENIKIKDVVTGAIFTYEDNTTASNVNAKNPQPADVAITGMDSYKKEVSFDFLDDEVINGKNGAEQYNSKKTTYKYFVPVPTEGEKETEYLMSCKVTFTTSANTGSDKLTTYKEYENLKLSCKYEAGQSYVFTANVYDMIQPITFTVSVEQWKEDKDAGDITIGQGK